MIHKRLLIAFLGLAAAAPAHAQSLFATRGLGLPMTPVDSRARALGGIGVGLLGVNTSLINPADVAGLGRRGVSAAMQPWSGSATLGDLDDDVNGTRFPMVRLMFPMQERLVLSLGFGAVLEQSWGIVAEGSEPVGGVNVSTRDVIQASGGIGQITLSAAYSIRPNLAIGAGAGVYTGNLERQVTRTFNDTTVQLDPFETELRWRYSGPQASVGIRYDPVSVVRLGASLTASGDLDIDGREGVAQDDVAKLPFRFTAGASSWLSPELMLAVGTEYAWREEGGVFSNAGALSQQRATWRAGAGLEYEGTRSANRVYPIRLGASWAQLPYFDTGETPASEWSAAFGLGFRLAGDEAGPLAVADATLERGGRSGLESTLNPSGLSESFWRFTFGLSLFGF